MRPPRSATILVGAFSLLVTAIAAAAGTTLLWPGGPIDVIWSIRNDDTHAKMLALGWPVGAGLWVLAVVALALAVGSFAQRRWAWWLAAAGISVNGVADLGRLATGGIVEGLVGAVIAGLILFWLTRPTVRVQFSR
jgi:hypothetical protein